MGSTGRIAARIGGWAGLVLLILAVAPFALYAAEFGLRGLGVLPGAPSRFFLTSAPLASGGIAVHMVAGGVVTVLAPLQLVGVVRRRWPAVHRWLGRGLVTLAVLAGLGGLAFIAGRGTVGGAPMNAGFAVYGVLMVVCAVAAIRFARAGAYERHRRWALRLFVLIVGSWLYRVHYGLWEIATGGAGRAPDFSGPFDLVQVWAFYVPYLLALELWFRVERRRA